MLKDRLRILITQKGWTVPTTAKVSGVSANTIYKMLRGERGEQSRHSTIAKLAHALGVTPKELLGEEKQPEPSDPRERDYIQFAARNPQMRTVLADHPLDPEKAFVDNFGLRCKLGPLYDVLRDPETRTPMTIAIYGAWGTGKTSAMRWLHGLISHWNKHAVAENKIKVEPVWFYPWKYDNKEDVWRGLIWEVIVSSIVGERATLQTIKYAAKRFGPFLGKSFLHTLTSIRLKPKALNDTADRRVDLADMGEILAEYQDIAHPEKVYLNEFESSLREWVETMLGNKERMVIFIDDLDRCTPEVTLQVVQAMNLYLNIEKLIFVVGVDKKAVQELVDKHYEGLRLSTEKSGEYLAKMFPVEIYLTLTEQQISNFLDEQLKKITYWNGPHLSDDERQLFRDIIFKLAERNPREVKRLINSSMMTGAGAMMMKTSVKDQGEIKFNQGLQLFFVRKILDDRYTMGSEVSGERGIAFFDQWSQIVRAGRTKDKDFPCSIRVPKDFGKPIPEQGPESEASRRLRKTEADPLFAPPDYHPLLKNPRFSGLLDTLGDKDLGKLMRIPYPTEATQITVVVGASEDADIVRETIARRLGKRPDELTSDDYGSITRLDLSGSEICDLEPIKALTCLRWLSLSWTKVTDLEPMKGLTSLQELYLSGTKVADLQLIRELRSLQRLDLRGMHVSDEEVAKLREALPDLTIQL